LMAASFLGEIGKITLKKSKSKTKDRSAPVLTSEFTQEHVKKVDDIWQSYDFENWFELIEHVSFPSHYLELSVSDAKTILQWCQAKTVVDFSEIGELYSKLQKLIAEVGKGDGVFVKLSSRSAKDATDVNNRLENLFMSKVKELSAEERQEDNKLVSLMAQATTDCLKVNNADEVFSMFSHSERIEADLATCLKYPDEFHENIIIRPWVQIDIDMEFRCFVCNGVFTALCQYSYLTMFERLINLQDSLRDQIVSFWEQECRDNIAQKFESYVIDIAVVEDRCFVIEINPWQAGTDAALFSWKNESHILENPSPDIIPIRVVDTVPDDCISFLPGLYRDLIKRAKKL